MYTHMRTRPSRAALGQSRSAPFADAGMLQSFCQGTLGIPTRTLPQKSVGWGDRNTAPASTFAFVF